MSLLWTNLDLGPVEKVETEARPRVRGGPIPCQVFGPLSLTRAKAATTSSTTTTPDNSRPR